MPGGHKTQGKGVPGEKPRMEGPAERDVAFGPGVLGGSAAGLRVRGLQGAVWVIVSLVTPRALLASLLALGTSLDPILS